MKYARPLNRPDESPQLIDEQRKPADRIIDRLDLQLLVAVIVFFVSAWAYLNNTICDFTESEPNNVQMSFILVHYILTLYLIVCVIITAIKGDYILKKREEDIQGIKFQIIQFFIESWFFSLVICIAVLLTATIIPWYVWVIVVLFLLCVEMRHMGIKAKNGSFIFFCFILLFFFFISSMTMTVKEITVHTDREQYAITDDVMISVESKGYACQHTLVCLGAEELHSHSSYVKHKNVIVIPATCIKNNLVSVGTVSPASSFSGFLVYPLAKMLNKDSLLSLSLQKHRGRVYYTAHTVIIKP